MFRQRITKINSFGDKFVQSMKNDDECCKGEKLKEKRKFKRKQTGKNILKVRIWKKYKIL
jgi:hypothetical protein